MKLISFDALRTLNFPATPYIKPDHYLSHETEINAADWLLFPEYWQLNVMRYAFKKRIFPSPASYAFGYNKVEMTRAFMAVAPAHVPYTLIHGNSPEKADEIWQKMPLPFVAKIPKSSMGEGVFLIESLADWHLYCLQTDTLYAQEYLPIDRDLRIVVIGDKVVGGYWRIQSDNGFHNNIARGGVVLEGPIPEAAIRLVLKLARTLGIDHAGFDIAMVDHYPFVLEFNRMFGTQGINKLIGDTTPMILAYLASALNDDQPDDPNNLTPKGLRRRKSAVAA